MADTERQAVVIKSSPHRQMGYTSEFRQLLRQNPGVMGAAFNLAKQAEAEYNPTDINYGSFVLRWNKGINNWQTVANGDNVYDEPMSLGQAIWGRGALLKPGEPILEPKSGLEVTILGRATRELGGFLSAGPERLDISSYFRMKLGDSDFFVKKSIATTNPGFNEFSSSVVVKQALSGIEGLSVTEAHLGYTDQNQSWFSSKWENLEGAGFFPHDTFVGGVPNDYGVRFDGDQEETLLESGHSHRVEKLQEEMKARAKESGFTITDLDVNLFYNPKTDKFFYLDVTTKEGGYINQNLIFDEQLGRYRFLIPSE